MTSKKTTVLMARVPNETLETIKKHAEREGRSISSVVADMLGAYLWGELPEEAPGELPEDDLAGEPSPGIPSEEAPKETLGVSPRELPGEDLGRRELPTETRLRESSEPRKTYGVDWKENRPVYPGTLADYEEALRRGSIKRGQFTAPAPPSKERSRRRLRERGLGTSGRGPPSPPVGREGPPPRGLG